MDVSADAECHNEDRECGLFPTVSVVPTGRVVIEGRFSETATLPHRRDGQRLLGEPRLEIREQPRSGWRITPSHEGHPAENARVLVETRQLPPRADCENAVRRIVAFLQSSQHADGHWRAALEGDTILESEYLLLLAWLGRLDRPEVAGAVQRIRDQQLPEGGWAIYPGGATEVSASVKAYLVLKLVGHSADEPEMRRARQAIAAMGGPWAVNSFTRYYLALLGQMSYAACPAVPPEIVLLPRSFPINLHAVSAWSRTMIVPLSLMWTFKPRCQVPVDRGIAELFDGQHHAPRVRSRGWEAFFRIVDRGLKACEAIGCTPLRRRAVAACEQWMLERFEESDGLGAIFPPMVWSIIALRCLGYADDSTEVQRAWTQLQKLIEREPDGTTRLEPCHSPVWDTAITLRSLCLATRLPHAVSAGSLDRAVDWLLDREIRSPGDWSAQVDAEPSAWCFEYANRFYPDVDDTAMVVLALVAYRDVAHRMIAEGDASSKQRLERIDACLPRATRWLVAMQNTDGGWGAFDRDNTMELLCKVPFADHNAMIDPSSPDLAGRVLEAFGRVGLREGHPAVERAIAYLRQAQEADGKWFGRWGVNYIYGTWQAIEGLRSVGVPTDDPAIVRGLRWLESHQQADGGWGESPRSYEDPAWAGRGEATASQTAWSVLGLTAGSMGIKSASTSVRRGLAWLVRTQVQDGSWRETAFTGTGFPKVFYLRYHAYPLYFPLQALARNLPPNPSSMNDAEAVFDWHTEEEVV